MQGIHFLLTNFVKIYQSSISEHNRNKTKGVDLLCSVKRLFPGRNAISGENRVALFLNRHAGSLLIAVQDVKELSIVPSARYAAFTLPLNENGMRGSVISPLM